MPSRALCAAAGAGARARELGKRDDPRRARRGLSCCTRPAQGPPATEGAAAGSCPSLLPPPLLESGARALPGVDQLQAARSGHRPRRVPQRRARCPRTCGARDLSDALAARALACAPCGRGADEPAWHRSGCSHDADGRNRGLHTLCACSRADGASGPCALGVLQRHLAPAR
jgi:hypothetical protein